MIADYSVLGGMTRGRLHATIALMSEVARAAVSPVGWHSPRYRIGLDIGGTFTDFILVDCVTGAVRLHKCLTTPRDPAEGALAGLVELIADARLEFDQIDELVHGTTLVTNAIVERRGVKVGLLTTKGFRDSVEMGIEQRYDIYDLFLRFPEPLAPRALRREIDERMSRDGTVLRPLDMDEVRHEMAWLAAAGVEAIAVCFLHSYRNPAHERAVAALAAREFPGIAVSLSAEVVPELREYERATTTLANAFVQPLMDRYIARIEAELRRRGFAGRFYLMQSAGGLASPEMARRFPIRLLESGPAGGGLATALVGRAAGQAQVISFDMGGTTAKACLVQDGRTDIAASMEAARVHRFKRGSGLPIKAPVIDMIEIGAGGGSIAVIDEVGLLKVGPQSAGADPGPACYGKGGAEPTVTDANLLLGYLDPGFFLGGRMALDRAAADRAFGRVARPLGLSTVEAAWGVYSIVCESMAAAARVHLVEKGRDPRGYAMVGFGGAGPAHAAAVAGILGVAEVIVPPASGAASALGFLAAPVSFEFARSAPAVLDEALDFTAINRLLGEIEAAGRSLLAKAGITGGITVSRQAEMRLLGQMHEIAVDLPDGELGRGDLDEVKRRFAATYTRLYTYLYAGAVIEALSWRVLVSGPPPRLSPVGEPAASNRAAALKGSRPAYFTEGFRDTPVYDRYALRPGDRIDGPAIIEEREATTVIPPGDRLAVDDGLNLRITIGEGQKPIALVTPATPHTEAVERLAADPIGLEIMWARLITIVEECWQTVCRTAFSLIISEAQDFAVEILDRDGNPLAHSPRGMPVFNLSLPRTVKALIAKFPPETLKPGDVLITNDPWLCAGHLFDIAVVTPVFVAGRLVGLMGTVGHVSDIGGTKDSLRAREIYEEGIQIPPMMLFRAGLPNEDLLALLAENVRNPNQVLGDLHALVAANELGARRLVEFMAEYGLGDLAALAEIVQTKAETAMREAIRAIPDGVYQSEIWNNPLGTFERYPLKLTVAGDEIHLDFAGAPPQLRQGGLNCTLNYTAAHATYPLKCLLTPNVRGNAGCYRPFTVSAPEGSVLNATKPAAVNLRTRTGWYLAPNIFMALAQAVPNQVQAFTGLPVAITCYGTDADGRSYSDHLFQGGGQGASALGDGKSSLLWPTSAANTSIELFEARTPLLVLDKSYVADSGGVGRQRGGLGQVVRVGKLFDDGRPTLASVYPEGVAVRIPGMFGGKPGGDTHGWLVDRDGNKLKDYGVGELETLTAPDQIIELQLAGGSGFGDPLERPLALVENDLANGYITAAGAAADYGCVVGGDGRIDRAASEARRCQLRAGLAQAAG
jgi:5-oxoprolinase (ATP-hydrolysing)